MAKAQKPHRATTATPRRAVFDDTSSLKDSDVVVKPKKAEPNPGPTRGELLRLIRNVSLWRFSWNYDNVRILQDEQAALEKKLLQANARWRYLQKTISCRKTAGREKEACAAKVKLELLRDLTLVIGKPGPALVRRVRAFLRKYQDPNR